MSFRSATATLCLLALSGGCVRVNPRPAFQDVSGIVAGRTDKSIEWARDAAETERLERRARELLGQSLTAETAAQVALLNNRKLQASFEEIAVSQANLVQAGLVSNPEFGFSIRFSSELPSVSNLEFGLAQDFLDFVLLSPRKKIAVAELEHSKLMVATEVLDLIAEVKSAFYTLQASQQLTERLELILQINEAAAELAERQFEAGTMNLLDRDNHRATYQQSRVDLARAKLQVRLDRERLNRLLGLWGADTGWQIGSQLPTLPERKISLKKLESFAVSQRLDIEAARWGVNIYGRALALKRGTRFFPLGVNVGVSSERESSGEWVTGPSVSLALPIFDQGQATIAALQAQMFHQQRHLEALAVEVRSRVREARDLMIATRASPSSTRPSASTT